MSLVDATAARFGQFEIVHVVGLVETDWPERPRRSIFYSRGLLKSLGWPQDSDQAKAQQAAFRDLLALPTRALVLHAFQMEGDAIVARSPMVEAAATIPSEPEPAGDPRLVFADERLTIVPPCADGLDESAGEWLRARHGRPAMSLPAYTGFVLPQPPRGYAVSRVDRYVDCPFKYFSESVLGLPEERDVTPGLTPLERGTFLHELFETFYRTWQEQGGRAITDDNLPRALALFASLTRDALAHVPALDRVLEETRLLGSIVARGVAERVFELEVGAGREVAGRLLEFELRGTFLFPKLGGLEQKAIEIRGKVDRLDVLEGGGLRIVDYKLGRLPDESSIQIAVYGHAARQALEARDGQSHPVEEAMYLAFGDERRTAGPLGGKGEPVEMAVQAGADRFVHAVTAIEAGTFPPRPKRPGDCRWCGYSGVCRKEYVLEDDAAESV